jgi:hypothetical protein
MPSFSITAKKPQVCPCNRTFTDTEIIMRVQNGHRHFFEYEGQYLTQPQINLAFQTSLEKNQSFFFCQSIIDLKPQKIVESCLFYKQYDLFLKIVEHYGLPVLEPEILRLPKALSDCCVDKQKLPLFRAIIQCLPNHTKKLNKHYLPDNGMYIYFPYNNNTYKMVYQNILLNMIDSDLPVLEEAFFLLAKKCFPLGEKITQLILTYKIEPFISMKHRLNQAQQISNDINVSQGIGWHHELFSQTLTSISLMVQKNTLLKELMYHFHAPKQVGTNISYSMQKKTGKMIPDELEYRWISQFEHKPWVLHFFNRFYYYDKIKLYQKLQSNLNVDDINTCAPSVKI